MKFQKQLGQFANLENSLSLSLSQAKTELSLEQDELKANINSQLQSVTTINSMVTKIIEEQAKTNKAVSELSS